MIRDETYIDWLCHWGADAFSCGVLELVVFLSFRIPALSIVPHALSILTANVTCCIVHVLIEYVDMSQVNALVV